MKRFIIVAFGCLTASPLSAQSNDLLQAARQQAMVGAFEDSDKDFQSALKQATDNQSRAEIKIDYAESLGRTAEGRPEAAKLNKQAAELYEAALPAVTGELRVRAANNYGVLLLREEKVDRATEVLESIRNEPSLIADKQSYARYLYNLGRANELSNKPDEARMRYEEAARTDPSFVTAARAVTRIANNQPPTKERLVAEAAWVDTLTDRGDLTLAGDALERAFARPAWRTQDAFPYLLRALMSFLTAARVPIGVFNDTWAPRLRELPEVAPASRSMGKELIAIYVKDLPVSFDPIAAHHLFEASLTKMPPRQDGTPPQVILSRLLKTAGDIHVEQNQVEKGLQRYSLGTAVDLHGSSIDTALYAANLLLGHGNELAHADQYLDQLVARLFEAKGGAYLGEDWNDILRLHAVLGSIFQERQKWGSEGDPRSAIFQFDHALRAYQHAAANPTPVAPVNPLRIRLATSYDGAERYEDAARTYLDAAQGAIDQQNNEVAREALEGAERIKESHSVSAQQLARLEALRAKAVDLTPAAPPLPIDVIDIPLAKVANQTLAQTDCFRPTNKYRTMVSDFGKVDAQTRVIETEREGHNAPAEVAVNAVVDRPRQVLALLCVTHVSDEALQEQTEIGKLRFEFATGSPLLMPIANIGSDPAWIRLSAVEGSSQRTYLRPLVIPLRKPFSTGKLVRVVLIDSSRDFDDSRDPGLTLIKLLVGKKQD